jgi:hypothetical protein
MRKYVLLLGLVVSDASLADSPGCGDNALTPKQMTAVLDGKPNGDPVLLEAMALPRLSALQPLARAKSPKPISWEQARAMILLGAVVEFLEKRDLTVTLTTRGGNAYLTREPRDAEVSRLSELVDPCHTFIRHIVE